MKYAYILAEISRQLWAITPEAMNGILAALDGELGPEDRELFHAADLEAVISHVGESYSDELKKARVLSGVGVVVIDGPIVPRGNVSFDTSGIVSIDRLTAEFKAFENDPDIREILFLIDSPGGSVTGISEFAALIEKSEKPTAAYVYGFAASAAYWIASATDLITVADTGLVGSIGTVLTVRRKSENDPIEIVSSQSPNKRPDAETDEGRRELLRIVDGLAGVFVDTVARNRGVSAEQVTKDFGRGGLVLAPDALRVGMVDGIETLDNYIAGRVMSQDAEGDEEIPFGATIIDDNNIDNFSEKIEKQKDKDTASAVESKGETMPNLKEFLEENPEAKAEHERLLDEARSQSAEPKPNSEDDIEFASKFVSGEYPEKIRAIALDVIKGKRDRVLLESTIAVYDSLKADKEIEQAAADSDAAGATPGQKTPEPSADGVISTPAQVEAEAKRLKGE